MNKKMTITDFDTYGAKKKDIYDHWPIKRERMKDVLVIDCGRIHSRMRKGLNYTNAISRKQLHMDQILVRRHRESNDSLTAQRKANKALITGLFIISFMQKTNKLTGQFMNVLGSMKRSQALCEGYSRA